MENTLPLAEHRLGQMGSRNARFSLEGRRWKIEAARVMIRATVTRRQSVAEL